jgi:hypothetical protein
MIHRVILANRSVAASFSWHQFCRKDSARKLKGGLETAFINLWPNPYLRDKAEYERKTDCFQSFKNTGGG